MERERVFNWTGGPLQIVRVLDGPTGPLHWEPVEVIDCLPLAHGLALPARPVPVTTREGELVAELEVGVVAGRAACVAIRAAAGHELTTLLLRQLPGLGKIVRTFATAEAVRVTRSEDGQIVGERYVDASDFTGLDAARQELLAEVKGQLAPRPRHRLSEEFLREVADVYRTAYAEGDSTQRAIQKKLGPTTEASARRWVSRARKAGFLGEAPSERRAGEQEKPKRPKGKT